MSELVITRWRGLYAPMGMTETMKWDSLATCLARPLPCPVDVDTKPGVPGWAPVAFNGTRAKANVVGVYALGFDFDKGAPSLASVLGGFTGLGVIVHSTGKYTPVAPRWRVVVRSSRAMNRDEHTTVWRSEAGRLERVGLIVDPATKDASRFWYMPTEPTTGAFVHHVEDGAPLDVDAVLEAAETSTSRPTSLPSVTVSDVYQAGAIRSAVARVASAPRGTRNATLNTEAWSLARLGLDHATIAAALSPAASAGGLTPHEVVKTIASGVDAGRDAEPRAPRLEPPTVRSFIDAALDAAGLLLGSLRDRNRARCPSCGADDAVSYAPRDHDGLGAFACRCGARRDAVLAALPPMFKARAARRFPRALGRVAYRAARARVERFTR